MARPKKTSKAKTTITGVEMPIELVDRLKAQAEKEYINFSSLVRQLLAQGLATKEQK